VRFDTFNNCKEASLLALLSVFIVSSDLCLESFSAAEHLLVRGVHDGVDRKVRDVAPVSNATTRPRRARTETIQDGLS
jgi:hypothetical protein